MSGLQDRVGESIRRRRLFQPKQRILVAVSGGVDSMVLLDLLYRLSLQEDWRLMVAHLNHRLRGNSSKADERLVRRVSAQLELPIIVEEAEVREFARTRHVSIEMAARTLRHDFLARAAAKSKAPSIALAHHADDQLELFFLRLLRGSSGEGLAGMKWSSPSPANPEITLVRPLLDQPKAGLREYATETGISFREDATNAHVDIQRNRIRHHLLPVLREEYQPALDKTVLRVMELVRAEADFVTQAASGWLGRARRAERALQKQKEAGPAQGNKEGNGGKAGSPPQFDGLLPGGFDHLPAAVQRRCVQLQLIRLGIEAEFDLVERLRMEVGRPVSVRCGSPPASFPGRGGGTGKRLLTLGGGGLTRLPKNEGVGPHSAVRTLSHRFVARDASGLLRLQDIAPQSFNPHWSRVMLRGRTGRFQFGEARITWQIRSKRPAATLEKAAGKEAFDADRVGAQIRLRYWLPGDRFQPIGMGCAVKLQDIFTNEKVSRARRRRLIIAETAEGEVFWVQGLRISERFKVTDQTIRLLQWRWRQL